MASRQVDARVDNAMDVNDYLKFSIIVPTYNEEQDIGHTLKALEQLDYPSYEVIIVDDGSEDRTPQIALDACRRNPNFAFFKMPQNRGVSTARNFGIGKATGEVVVILNADVLLPGDFLARVAPYYRQGAQWVSVWCNAINRERFLARYTQLSSDHYHIVRKKHFVWTEAFSCTKTAAIAVGLFPEEMPGCSGEDVDFGLNLENRFPGVKDTTIVVPHVAPDSLRGFWNQNRGRGRGRTNVYFYMRKMRGVALVFNTLASSAKRIVKLIIGAPVLQAAILSRHSEMGIKDLIPLAAAGYIAETAMLVGMWQAFFRLK